MIRKLSKIFVNFLRKKLELKKNKRIRKVLRTRKYIFFTFQQPKKDLDLFIELFTLIVSSS